MKNIGEIIRFLRKSKNLSQEQLSDLIGCTREFISQLERGKCNVPDYLVLPLSNFLNYDIPSLIKNIDKYNNFNHYVLSCRLINCIDSKNNIEINELLQNDIIINEFNYGYPLILKRYCVSLVELHINNDSNASIAVCLKQLDIENINEVNEFSPKISQEDRYYSTILVLGVNLHLIGEEELHKTLLKNTLFFLEENIFNNVLPSSSINYFFKKFYIIILNNYSDILFNLNDWDLALSLCEKARLFAINNNILFLVELLLKLKIEILCSQDNYAFAKETYQEFKYICRFINKIEYYDASTELFKTKYPNLFL